MLEAAGARDGDLLNVQGKTDLLDGATLIGEVRDGDDAFSGTGVPLAPMVVTGGRFASSVSLTDLPAGPIAVWISFQPMGIDLAPEVQEIYGAFGEKLSGPNVVAHTPSKGARRVEVEFVMAEQ